MIFSVSAGATDNPQRRFGYSTPEGWVVRESLQWDGSVLATVCKAMVQLSQTDFSTPVPAAAHRARRHFQGWLTAEFPRSLRIGVPSTGAIDLQLENETHFVAIRQDGARAEWTRGALGTDGETRGRTLQSAELTTAWIAAWTDYLVQTEGFEKVDPTPPDTRVRLLLWNDHWPVVVQLAAHRNKAIATRARLPFSTPVDQALADSDATVEVLDDPAAAEAWVADQSNQLRTQGATEAPLDREPELGDLPPMPKAVRALLRPVWLPTFGDHSEGGWLGGRPHLDPDAPWPVVHGLPLAFIGAFRHPDGRAFQLFAPWDELQEEVDDDVEFDVDFDQFDPYSADDLVVLPLGSQERPTPPGVPVYARNAIAGWTESIELPSFREPVCDRLWGLAGMPAALWRTNRAKLKLGGWPMWIQDPVVYTAQEQVLPFFVQLPSGTPAGRGWGPEGYLYVFVDARAEDARALIQFS